MYFDIAFIILSIHLKIEYVDNHEIKEVPS